MNFSKSKRYAHYLRIPHLAVLQAIRITAKSALILSQELGMDTDDTRAYIAFLLDPKFDACGALIRLHKVDRDVTRYTLTKIGRSLLDELEA